MKDKLKMQIERITKRRKYKEIFISPQFSRQLENRSTEFKKVAQYTGRLITNSNNIDQLRNCRKSGSWVVISIFRAKIYFWTSYYRKYFTKLPNITDTKNFAVGIITHSGIEMIENVLVEAKSTINSLNIYNHKLFPTSKKPELNEAFYLLVNGSNQFQHFVQDCLPILVHIKSFLERNPTIPLIVNKPNMNLSTYKYFFNLIGVTNPHIFIEDKSLTVKNLYLLNFKPKNPIYGLPQEMYASMYSHILTHKIYRKSMVKNLVCFVRTEKTRNFKNEDFIKVELTKRAKELGLRIFFINPTYENTDYVVEVLSNAKYVFGAHGGALYNMIFAAPDATLIEFIATESTDSLYHLIRSFGQNYFPYAIPMSKTSNYFTVSKNDLDLIFESLICH